MQQSAYTYRQDLKKNAQTKSQGNGFKAKRSPKTAYYVNTYATKNCCKVVAHSFSKKKLCKHELFLCHIIASFQVKGGSRVLIFFYKKM